jgi:DNA-binding transcriptional LysR family regulator
VDFRIRQLQCFLTLSDLLNYNKTAHVLYMSQPAITFQIKSLEEAFGVKLLVRDRQHVRLTDAGIAFREYAQSIVDMVHSANECMGRLHNRLHLRLSCGPVGQFVLLPSILRMLAAKYPDFELEVMDLTTEQQIARLSEGTIDLLLMVGELPISGVCFDPICEDGLIAVLSCRSSLAEQSSLSIQCLRETPVIASRMKDCRFHQPFLHDLLAPFGITPRVVESPQSCSVQFAYAAAGKGVAISTQSMAAFTFPGIEARPFQEQLPNVLLGLATMESNQSDSLAIFRRVAKDCALTAFTKLPAPAKLSGNLSRPIAVAS